IRGSRKGWLKDHVRPRRERHLDVGFPIASIPSEVRDWNVFSDFKLDIVFFVFRDQRTFQNQTPFSVRKGRPFGFQALSALRPRGNIVPTLSRKGVNSPIRLPLPEIYRFLDIGRLLISCQLDRIAAEYKARL